MLISHQGLTIVGAKEASRKQAQQPCPLTASAERAPRRGILVQRDRSAAVKGTGSVVLASHGDRRELTGWKKTPAGNGDLVFMLPVLSHTGLSGPLHNSVLGESSMSHRMIVKVLFKRSGVVPGEMY